MINQASIESSVRRRKEYLRNAVTITRVEINNVVVTIHYIVHYIVHKCAVNCDWYLGNCDLTKSKLQILNFISR